jgi:hypothetical protein
MHDIGSVESGMGGQGALECVHWRPSPDEITMPTSVLRITTGDDIIASVNDPEEVVVTRTNEGAAAMEIIAFWVLVIILLLLMVSRGEGNLRRSKRVLEICEENRTLARQQTAMQAETNRLLGQLTAMLDRDQGDRSSHE